ncbi:divisome protein SepX/GlpR [Sphaerimonospora mesophila]|uniref:divisome protein SepX/GlpR n=1 Tax=Sphaerimonospora mesophila TaxID=37483 RepID=UPI0006E1A8EF
MGSAILYFAIVVMWLSVLLPMWLRRDRHVDEEVFNDHPTDDTDTDTDTEGEADTVVEPPAEQSGQEASPPGEPTDIPSPVEATTPEESAAAAPRPAAVRQHAGKRRARILARRRRRLLWSVLLVLASVVTAAVRVMPWWGVAPSGVLLVGYLAVLRIAVRIDREQRERAAAARAAYLRRQRERRRAMAREAEIIEFEARRQVKVFDQYAEGRRAVGD